MGNWYYKCSLSREEAEVMEAEVMDTLKRIHPLNEIYRQWNRFGEQFWVKIFDSYDEVKKERVRVTSETWQELKRLCKKWGFRLRSCNLNHCNPFEEFYFDFQVQKTLKTSGLPNW